MPYLAALVCGYLLGSIPIGLLVGRFTKGVDVRDYGSGKTGFTNTLRVLGFYVSMLVFAGDFCKGVAATLLPLVYSDEPAVRAVGGLAAVVGHIWPVWADFRGGRGVLTGAGVLVALDPLVLVAVAPAALLALGVTRIMSVTSLTGGVAAAITFVIFALVARDPWSSAIVATAGVALITALHKGNISRLRHGAEPKIGQGGERLAGRG